MSLMDWIPFVAAYPSWVKLVVSGWLVITAVVIGILVYVRRPSAEPKEPAAAQVEVHAPAQPPAEKQRPSRKASATSSPARRDQRATIDDSPNSVIYQASRDIVVTGAPIPQVPQSQPVARLPLKVQVANVRARIKYLVNEHLRGERRMGLDEVFGPVGDGMLDSPALYDQRGVIRHLVDSGEISIVSDGPSNIVFDVKDELLRTD